MELVIYEYQEKLLGNIKIISSQNSVTRAQAETRAKKGAEVCGGKITAMDTRRNGKEIQQGSYKKNEA